MKLQAFEVAASVLGKGCSVDAEHDEVFITAASPDDIGLKYTQKLEEAGWHWSNEYGYWSGYC